VSTPAYTPNPSGSFLDLPPESIERHKAVGLWYEGDTLRVRAHLRDAYTGPAGPDDGDDDDVMVLHEYQLELWIDGTTHEITKIEVVPLNLPYEECFDAPGFVQQLVGLRLERGFTGKALALLEAEAGCTHLNSLISDLAIAGLFCGYVRLQEQARTTGALPIIPASDERTGVCTGWRAGGALSTWMESGKGIAPSRIYPTVKPGPTVKSGPTVKPDA
jgi:Protein of unknown function (DUF2889)